MASFDSEKSKGKLFEKLDNHSGLDLISKQGYGYKLDILDDDAYADFLEENHINDHQFNYQSVTDINDRYNFLLNKLLFEQNEIYFDDLADELDKRVLIDINKEFPEDQAEMLKKYVGKLISEL